MNPRLELEWPVPNSASIQSEQGCCPSAIKNNQQKTTKKHKQETTGTGEKHHSRNISGKRPTSRNRGLQPR